MADTIVGQAAEAVAAEGGAVTLVPNAAAEAAEQGAETPQEPVTVMVDASPTIITPPSDDGAMTMVLARLESMEARLEDLAASRVQDVPPGLEVGPALEPSASETVIEPSEEIAPKVEEAATPTKRHAGFLV